MPMMTSSPKSPDPAPHCGTVTALVAQVQQRGRVNLFIDGEFALGISHTTLVRERLAVGAVIDEPAWQRLVTAESADRTFQRALRLLERRARTQHELRQRLQRAGIEAALIESTLDRLRELGLLDDADYAERYVAERNRLSPRGQRALQAELRSRGVAPELVQQTIAAQDPAEEPERLLRLAEQVLPRYLRSPDWLTFQRRLGGFLLRRGFSAAAVQPLLRRLWQRRSADGDDAATGADRD
jgi:regulatory protein